MRVHRDYSEGNHYTREPVGIMPLKLGERVFYVAGGPYAAKPAEMLGVNMAQEISKEAAIRVPTKDFSIPDYDEFAEGIKRAFYLLYGDFTLYVGCMGGIGRTGLFLSGMQKVAMAYNLPWYTRFTMPAIPESLVIAAVRKHYCAHAVETQEQRGFVAAFNPYPIVKYIRQRG